MYILFISTLILHNAYFMLLTYTTGDMSHSRSFTWQWNHLSGHPISSKLLTPQEGATDWTWFSNVNNSRMTVLQTFVREKSPQLATDSRITLNDDQITTLCTLWTTPSVNVVRNSYAHVPNLLCMENQRWKFLTV